MKKASLFLLAFVPVFAFAHAGGPSIETVVGDHKFDIGYSQEPVAGELVRYDIAVSPASGGDEIPFTSAWVKIEEGKKTVFAGPIAYGEFGKPGFSIVFPKEGSYSLFVRFQDGSETIAEGEFPFSVGAPEGSKASFLVASASALLGAVVGALIILFLKKKHA
ncbi:MAG: hypothetical protein HZA81_03475 [Candidatus Taylorbacteria bacterium]|nr:hypothetical protein [Candidatus Taylorbacteria bacterium]